MSTPEYTTAVDGLDIGVRVHHVSLPSVRGTVTQMAVFTARVQWDNGVDAWQSISVLRPVPPVHCECGERSGERCQWEGPEEQTVMVEYMPDQHRATHDAARNRGIWPHNGARRIRVERVCAARMVSLGRGGVSVL